MKPENLKMPDLPLPLNTYLHHYNRYSFAKHFIKPYDRIIDLGCGTGYGTTMLNIRQFNIIIGIDLNKESIEYAKKTYPDFNFIHADVCTFDITSFDFATCFEVIEHLDQEQGERLLRHVCMSNINTFIFSTPKDAEIGINPFHKTKWYQGDFENALDTFDRIVFFGQDWASGQIHYPFSKQHSMLIGVALR